MKIKRFSARRFSEALEMVKKELGGDAVILSTEEKRRGLLKSVEVIAAVDFDETLPEHTISSQVSVKKGVEGSIKGDDLVDMKSLLQEISELKGTIQELRAYGYELNLPQKKREILLYLRDRAIREEFGLRLCEKAESIDGLPMVIASELNVRRPSFNKKAIMLIGPTGVGKTTTIAKLAWVAQRQGRRVGLLSLDTYRIGAIEQIRIYAKIMGIPLVVVSTEAGLREGLERFSSSRDTIFIDTTGRSPYDREFVKNLSSLCSDLLRKPAGGFALEIHLLISANSDDCSMIEASSIYKEIPYSCIAFTKIDEAVRFGQLYNFSLIYNRPISYITTGQIVPDDIKFPSPEELANLILSKGYPLSSFDGLSDKGGEAKEFLLTRRC